MDETTDKLNKIKEKLGLGHYHRHVFLCVGPRCCTPEVGEAAWETLKNEITNRGLLGPGPQMCYRTRAGCLRVCTEGPTALVYPEGTWYHGLAPERIPLFVEQHLINNEPVREWIFAENELPKVD
jgi:(2Fe-2S) ferredoxin